MGNIQRLHHGFERILSNKHQLHLEGMNSKESLPPAYNNTKNDEEVYNFSEFQNKNKTVCYYY